MSDERLSGEGRREVETGVGSVRSGRTLRDTERV